MNLSYIFEGRECEIEIEVEPADHSVGIMGIGIRDFTLKDEDGKEITLTEEQANKIFEDEKLLERISSHAYDDPDMP